MKRLLALVSALLLVWACARELPSGLQNAPSGLSGLPLQTTDSIAGKCHLTAASLTSLTGCPTTTASALPMFHQCQVNCHQSLPQPDPVHIVFSKPAYEVDVISVGTYLCGPSDKGHVQYFSGGRVVETGAMALSDSITECETPDRFGGLDSLAQNVVYHSTYKGGIDSLVISRPQPDSVVVNWPPYNTDTTGLGSADLSANYSVYLFEQRPATATTCLTGNPIFDQQNVRDFFRSLWDSSGVSLPSSQRVEHGGWIYQDSATGALITIPTMYNAATDGPCSSYYEPPEVGGNLPIAHVHTHPFLRGESVTCPAKNGKPAHTGFWDPLTSGAPSQGDILNISSNHVQEFILDSTDVYTVPPNVTTTNSRGVTTKKHRHQSSPSCYFF